MKSVSMMLAVLLTFTVSSISANTPKLGDMVDGGVFLYREDVEIFWNDWIAYPLTERSNLPTPSQLNMTIIGEGKTVDFIGNVSINCNNGRYFWRSAVNWKTYVTDEEILAETIPEEVILGSISLLCHR